MSTHISVWKLNGTHGRIVAGDNGKEWNLNQIHTPRDIIIDKQNYSFIIDNQQSHNYMNYELLRVSQLKNQYKDTLITIKLNKI